MTRQALAVSPYIASLGSAATFFSRPARILRGYPTANLRYDLVAGLTVGVILLPQALVFSVMAGVPPQMGLYTAIVASIVGALWGSSNHLHTGPTNTSSLLIFSSVHTLAVAGSPAYLAAAGLLTVMTGVIRLSMGVLRLGLIVNFVSDSVVVGFTAGAGALIIVNQLRSLLRLEFAETSSLTATVRNLVTHFPESHWLSLAMGVGTIVFIVVLQHYRPRLPGAILAVTLTTGLTALFNLEDLGLKTIGEVQGGLPPLAQLPLFNLELIGDLSFGALAVAAIGLVEASSIARSIASQSGQRLDSNQEFIGQGLANIASGFLSGYASSGSFNRSTANYQAGARTPIAAALAGVFVLLVSTLLAPLMSSVPRAALAGLLILNAYTMVDRKRMARIWRSARGEALIMVATLVTTLLLPLQFAVLAGILTSLAYYILRTSTPQVLSVLPDGQFRHFEPQPNKRQCPQLAVIEIRGDLYFGAVNHVEERILNNLKANPGQHYLLLRMHGVQQIDISGIHMIESLVRTAREQGGDVYLVKVRPPVFELMRASNFDRILGADHFLSEDEAITHIFHHVLDPTICVYECPVRAFKECQNLPKPMPLDLPPVISLALAEVETISSATLYRELRSAAPPVVLDVREPREFRQGHIPGARSISLLRLLQDPRAALALAPPATAVVLACRTGRRSRRAAAALQPLGYQNVRILEGGMADWEAAALLIAVEDFVSGGDHVQ